MSKVRTSLVIIGIVLAMLAASVLTVLGLFLAGVISANKPELEFTVNAVAEKEYDGTPLRATGFAWTSGSRELKEGHRVEGVIYGSQTEYGTSESDLRVTVYDSKGRDVTHEYSIKVNNCELKVTQRRINIIWRDIQIPYSGDELLIEDYQIYGGDGFSFDELGSLPEAELVEGHKLAISFPGFRNVGDQLPDISTWSADNFKIYNEVGQIVTQNYRIGYYPLGNIEIVPRQIGVKAFSVEKFYDGTPIEAAYQHVWGDMIGNDVLYGVEFNVSVDNIVNCNDSRSGVKLSRLIIRRQTGYDLVALGPEEEKNYELVDLTETGTVSFTVKRRDLTLQTRDLSKTYDGYALSNLLSSDDLPYTVTDLPAQFTLSASRRVLDTFINVCDTTYSIRDVTIECNGEDVTEQFNITIKSGVARITPIKIRSVLKDYALPYSGAELAIPMDQVGESLIENLFKYPKDHIILSDEVRDAFTRLQDVKQYFNTVSSVAIKNAGVYVFSAELNAAGMSEIGNPENILFEFSSAKLTVNQMRISVQYLANNGKAVTSSNPIQMTYNGTEVKPDFSRFVVSGDSTMSLSVTSALFKYTDQGNKLHYGNHALVGDHTADVTDIRIGLNGEGTYEDITQNCIIEVSRIYVTIDRVVLNITAESRYISESLGKKTPSVFASTMEETMRRTVKFEGLVGDDAVDYENFNLDYPIVTAERVEYKVDLDTVHIYDKRGNEVTECYEFANTEDGEMLSPVITVYFTD